MDQGIELNAFAAPPSGLRQRIHRRRHALLGTACALGLVAAPVTGSLVVMRITESGHPPAISAETATAFPLPSQAAPDPTPTTPPTPPTTAPPAPRAVNVEHGSRGRNDQ